MGAMPANKDKGDFAALFAAIDDSGYDGWVSAEYHPGMKTEKTLDWMTG